MKAYNKPVNPARWPFTTLACSDPGCQAPVVQSQGRARPPRGLLAMRYVDERRRHHA